MMRKTTQWFHPALHLMLAGIISLLTALFAFRSADLEAQTWITFSAFYIILGAMTLMFIFRARLTDPKTTQLLQFSFFLLGFVLMITGVLGMINSGVAMASVFLLTLFLPGLAVLRAGLHYKKNGV
ncbi:MAG: hypothetical protein U9Q77_10720 [Candidatus Marinimicrobia bacterium]|nr:hypothetical protein [Candidatus Neomarinimicrobiota bacterium]